MQVQDVTGLASMQPGIMGFSHGSGLSGELIRSATQSWAGHVFMYIGSGQIIEAVPPATRIAGEGTHDDALWAYKMPITPAQSLAAVSRAHALVGTPYDYPAYIGFSLELLKLADGKTLDPVFKADRWRVCSADIVDCYQFAGIPLDWAGAKMSFPGNDPNLVSPAMLLDLAMTFGWV